MAICKGATCKEKPCGNAIVSPIPLKEWAATGLAAWVGSNVYFELVDNSTDGFIAVDDVSFPEQGTIAHWQKMHMIRISIWYH